MEKLLLGQAERLGEDMDALDSCCEGQFLPKCLCLPCVLTAGWGKEN